MRQKAALNAKKSYKRIPFDKENFVKENPIVRPMLHAI